MTAAHGIEGRRAALVPALRRALCDAGLPCDTDPRPMPDTGLAHDHLRLADTGRIARLPKQSQMNLGAADNLAYQAACFERASRSGHAPRLHAILPPSEHLPRGGLVVGEIIGRPAQLPGDLPAIMQALAAIHALPLPEPGERAPLLNAADPLADLLEEIDRQAAHLGAAQVARDTRALIERNTDLLCDLAAQSARPPRCLISFDAHPGNFLIDGAGRAVLVDLEKGRYSAPQLDLAHATLYTSTTWDVATHAVLSEEETARACETWLAALPASADRAAMRRWILPMRRAMWLWSMTWCAKWRVLSDRDSEQTRRGEDWATENSEAALVAHVRNRVDHYLDPATAQRVSAGFDHLATLIGGE